MFAASRIILLMSASTVTNMAQSLEFCQVVPSLIFQYVILILKDNYNFHPVTDVVRGAACLYCLTMSGESLSDMVSANVIILQPGSLYLRLGRGTDLSPVKVIHCIARRRRDNRGGECHQDSLLPEQAKLDSRAWKTLEDSRLHVFQALSRAMRRDGTRRNCLIYSSYAAEE